MTTKVEKSLLIDVPVRVAYNQWTQFEDFPKFMHGVSEVRQLDDRRLHWVAEIGGVKRQWEAEILEQVPDRKISWASTEGATNAGAVHFSSNGSAQCAVTLSLEYEPEGTLETLADRLHIVEKQVQDDLQRFKSLVENRGAVSGGWRGTINPGGAASTPGVEAAASSRGDKDKAGLSSKVKVFAALAAAAGAVAAGAVRGARQGASHAYREHSATQTSRSESPTTRDQTIVLIDQPTTDQPVAVDPTRNAGP